MATTLKLFGFKQCQSDYSLFINRTNNNTTIVLAYIDDLLITGNDLSYIDDLKHKLGKEFKVNNLGIIKYFLGMEFTKIPMMYTLDKASTL